MFSFNRNLKIAETGLNRCIDDYFSKSDIIVDINLSKWKTNCNYYILQKHDNSDTSGLITCIPIDYLRKKVKSKEPVVSELEEKKDLFKLFLKKGYNMNDLEKIKYNNISLSSFYKPFLLQSSLSKTVDYAKIDIENNDLERELDMIIGFYDRDTLRRPKINDKSEWMGNNDIYEFLKRMITDDDNIFLMNIIYIEAKKNFYESSSAFYNSHFFNQLKEFKKSKKRFLVSTILYNSHFNGIVIDKEFKRKKKQGIVYFFDSQGYDPKTIKYNKNYFFLKSNMHLRKQKYNDLEFSSRENYHIDILSYCIKDLFDIELVVLNKFVIQLLNSECGMFSLFFLFLNVTNPPIKISDELKNYFTLIFKGDLSISQIRGMFYVTDEDVEYKDYINNLATYEMKNRKCLEFVKLEEKSRKNMEKVYNKIIK